MTRSLTKNWIKLALIKSMAVAVFVAGAAMVTNTGAMEQVKAKHLVIKVVRSPAQVRAD